MKESERLLKELRASGKTIADFSRERGIAVHRMYGITKRAKPRDNFVRVGISPSIKIVLSESIKIEVPVEQLKEILSVLGVAV